MDVLDRYVAVEARGLDELLELSWRAVDYVRTGIADERLADALRGAAADVMANIHEA